MLVVPRFDHCRLLLLRSGDECLDANNALSVLTAGAQLFISRRPVNIYIKETPKQRAASVPKPRIAVCLTFM